MPYASTVRSAQPVAYTLPEQTQKVCLAAFNSAWDEYAGASREETAHRALWPAVKDAYENGTGNG